MIESNNTEETGYCNINQIRTFKKVPTKPTLKPVQLPLIPADSKLLSSGISQLSLCQATTELPPLFELTPTVFEDHTSALEMFNDDAPCEAEPLFTSDNSTQSSADQQMSFTLFRAPSFASSLTKSDSDAAQEARITQRLGEFNLEGQWLQQPISLMQLLSRADNLETQLDEDMYDDNGFLKLQGGCFINEEGNCVV